MTDALSTWSQRIEDAQDESARRRLLAELGGWRARNLTDIQALRQAAYGMARLYAMLGDRESAMREAQSLVSLCQTHPPASQADLRSAQGFARSLGGAGVIGPRADRNTRSERPERRKKQARNEAPAADALHGIREAAAAGRLDEARGMLRGKKGAEASLLRAYVWLEEVRTGPAEVRDAQLVKLSGWLRRQARLPQAKREEAPASLQGPLAELLRRPVPDRRRARIRVLEEFAHRHPEHIGQLALLALDHQVALEGADVPAPWLVGLVAKAELEGQGQAVRDRIAALAEQGAVVVLAYAEWPYSAALSLFRALPEGTHFEGLRRGVLSRGGEPDDRKVWTLQYSTDQGHARAAFATPADAPYSEDYAPKVVERLKSLSETAPLIAPGEGNATLRSAAAAVGIATVRTEDLSDWVAALGPARPLAERAPRERKPRAETAETAPVPVPQGPPPEELLLAVLGADEIDADALRLALDGFERLHHAFVALREASLSPEAQIVFLRAVDALAPAKARLPEGISIAVRLASQGHEAAQALLLEAPSAERFGGQGVDQVLEAATALAGSGWTVQRAVRGAMARERRQDPVLSALGDAERSIWRLLVRREDVEASLMVLVEDSPEGRAAVPRLTRRVTALVLPEAAIEWYAAFEGPPATSSIADGVAALNAAL